MLKRLVFAMYFLFCNIFNLNMLSNFIYTCSTIHPDDVYTASIYTHLQGLKDNNITQCVFYLGNNKINVMCFGNTGSWRVAGGLFLFWGPLFLTCRQGIQPYLLLLLLEPLYSWDSYNGTFSDRWQ